MRQRLVICLLLGFILGGGLVLFAQSDQNIFSLEWDPVSHPALARYEVGWGVESRVYTEIRTVHEGEDYTIGNLLCIPGEEVEYFVAVRSCREDPVDICSPWSDELHGYPTIAGELCIAMPIPNLPRRTDVRTGQGS